MLQTHNPKRIALCLYCSYTKYHGSTVAAPVYKVPCPSLHQELIAECCSRVTAQLEPWAHLLRRVKWPKNCRFTTWIPPCVLLVLKTWIIPLGQKQSFFLKKKEKLDFVLLRIALHHFALTCNASVFFFSICVLSLQLDCKLLEDRNHAFFSFSISPSPTSNSSPIYSFCKILLNIYCIRGTVLSSEDFFFN